MVGFLFVVKQNLRISQVPCPTASRRWGILSTRQRQMSNKIKSPQKAVAAGFCIFFHIRLDQINAIF
jgi:hypothetical protein